MVPSSWKPITPVSFALDPFNVAALYISALSVSPPKNLCNTNPSVELTLSSVKLLEFAESVILKESSTSNYAAGAVVPMPTLPPASIATLLVLPILK